MNGAELKDRCRGSLVGGAAGDALGYPVEFVYSARAIRARYGADGITEYDPKWQEADAALVSDDTQMTLYTAEALIEAAAVGGEIMPTVCNAYLAWFGGQTGRRIRGSYDSHLAGIVELNQCRAPGNTCLSALDAIWRGGEPQNESKGCGGIMRVAPVAIYGVARGWTLKQIGMVAGEVAEITHRHRWSTFSSAMQAMLVGQCILADGTTGSTEFKAMVEMALGLLQEMYPAEELSLTEFAALINRAVALECDDRPDWEVIENDLGEGWVAEETLAISIFSVLRHTDDFKGCLVCAVNHGGDSDSTGAVAGNLIGAIVGLDRIPEKFSRGVQFYDLLTGMADRLIE